MDSFSFLDTQNGCGSPIWSARNHFSAQFKSCIGELDDFGPYLYEEGKQDTSLDVFDLPINKIFQSLEPQKAEQPASQYIPLNINRVLTYEDAFSQSIEHKPNTTSRKVNKMHRDLSTPKNQPSLTRASDSVKGFSDLVNKTSSFWMGKLSEQRSTTFTRKTEKDLQKNKMEGMPKTNVKQISRESCHSKSEVVLGQKDGKYKNCVGLRDFVRMKAQEIRSRDNSSKIIEKKIKKAPKQQYEKQMFTKKEDLEILKYYKQYGPNWEKIAQFFPSRRPAMIQNRFYSEIQGNMEILEPYGSSEVFKNGKQSYSGQPISVTEDVVDSYFNKDNLDNLGKSLLENGHMLEKIELFEDKENSPEIPNTFMNTRRLEEDMFREKSWEDRPKKEVIEILSGRISLLTSLYDQTRLEISRIMQGNK